MVLTRNISKNNTIDSMRIAKDNTYTKSMLCIYYILKFAYRKVQQSLEVRKRRKLSCGNDPKPVYYNDFYCHFIIITINTAGFLLVFSSLSIGYHFQGAKS